MKKILIIDGHPSSKSLIRALSDAYEKRARESGFEVRRTNVRELDFDPLLHEGYRQIQELEHDLLKAQEDVQWCEHLVLLYPMWWGMMPAHLKGYFDRAWLPGFAFKYHESDPMWDKLLSGRSARMIITSDAPTFWNWLVYRNAPYHTVRKMILRFCGFSPVRLTKIGGVKNLKEPAFQKVFQMVETLAQKGL